MFTGSQYVYYGMYLVGFAIMMVVSRRTCLRYGINQKDATVGTLITYVAGVAGAMVMGKIFSAVSEAVGTPQSSNVAIFGAVLFTPLILLIVFLLMKKSLPGMLDLLTPGIFIILTCAKFGCSIHGCCAGIPWSHGIYNPTVGEKVFPVQIFEVVTMTAVLIATQYFTRRSRFFRPGMAYPLTAGVYSVTRFFWEFARYYESDRLRHLLFGMTFWQLACILTIVVCAVLLPVLYHKNLKYPELKKSSVPHRKKKKR